MEIIGGRGGAVQATVSPGLQLNFPKIVDGNYQREIFPKERGKNSLHVAE
jgi:hypothetical protein